MKSPFRTRRTYHTGVTTHAPSPCRGAVARCVAVVAIASAVLPSAALSSEQAMRTVDVYDGLATLDIPETWNEIPPDVLEYFTLQSAESSGGLTVEVYQHGFRPGDPEADFAPPQVLIQIKESGRLGYRQFLQLPPIEVIRDRGAERIDGHMGPFLENLHLNEVFFDRETYSVHVANTMDLKYEGKAMVTSVSFLTERGLFTVHCYALISQNLAMRPVFERILDSVRIDESIRYRPHLSDRLPPTPALISYAIALFFAVLVAVVHFVQRRRRNA